MIVRTVSTELALLLDIGVYRVFLRREIVEENIGYTCIDALVEEFTNLEGEELALSVTQINRERVKGDCRDDFEMLMYRKRHEIREKIKNSV